MSKLDELLKEYCPNGVEYKRLGDIATISRGGNFQKKDYVSTGVPCIHYGQLYVHYNLFTDNVITYIHKDKAVKQKFAEPNDIIMAVTSENIEDVCKSIAWLGEEKVAVSGHSAIIHHSMNPKYLAYYLNSLHFYKQKVKLAHGTKVIEVTPSALNEVSIPVPPLPVQEEIVRILDSFTSLTAELQAELQARKKQYEYYQTILLTFSNAQYYTLESVCNVVDYRGKTPKKVDNGIFLVTAKNIRKGYIDYDKSQEYIAIENYDEVMKRGKPELGDVVITTEAPCGNIAQIDRTDIALAQRVIKYRAKDSTFLDNTYLKYVLLGAEFQNKLKINATGGTVKGIKGSKLHQLTIPIPPIEMQKKIVKILDCFYRICKGITTGIPAEIAARQKQYEYYRDKLLTFKELS